MPDGPLRTFGRVKGRPFKPRQESLLAEALPRLRVPDGPIAPTALFPRARAVALEIGFGGGEHLAAQAKAHPDWGFIGAEPFLNGVASCLALIGDLAADNVRVHPGDAREIVERLPPGCLERVYILFPDPWPKRRHWKRRLIQPTFVRELARVLKPGGEVRFATDWRHYAAEALATFSRDPAFAWRAERADDWRKPWAAHTPTRYELKRLGDTPPIWLRWEREGPAP